MRQRAWEQVPQKRTNNNNFIVANCLVMLPDMSVMAKWCWTGDAKRQCPRICIKECALLGEIFEGLGHLPVICHWGWRLEGDGQLQHLSWGSRGWTSCSGPGHQLLLLFHPLPNISRIAELIKRDPANTNFQSPWQQVGAVANRHEQHCYRSRNPIPNSSLWRGRWDTQPQRSGHHLVSDSKCAAWMKWRHCSRLHTSKKLQGWRLSFETICPDHLLN